jgi:hypothetical protein
LRGSKPKEYGAKKGRPQPIARTKDSLQKEYPVKVAFDTLRFPFEVTLSKVTGITESWGGRDHAGVETSISASKAIWGIRNQPFVPDSSAKNEFPDLRRCNCAGLRDTLDGTTCKDHGQVSNVMGETRTLKAAPRMHDSRAAQVDTTVKISTILLHKLQGYNCQN